MREAINIIWKLSVLAKLVVAGRLLQQGLAGEYPALLTACCVLPIKSLLLMSVYAGYYPDHGRQLARNLDPIEWAVTAWVVFELFSKWSKSYNGIGRFGKILLGILLGGALSISVACWHVEWEALVFAGDFRVFYIVNRIVLGTLALFVVGTWLFFRNYPVAVAPNVVRHTYIALIYFVVTAVCFLMFTLYGPKVVEVMNLLIVATGAGSFSAWAILLTRKGQIPSRVRQVSVEDRARIERINQELLDFMQSARTTARESTLRPPRR